ncbi:MAG TPA: response regulator transcription factor [Eoetvoesiella sp.]
MHAVPVLLLTHDDALWQHWRQIDPTKWLPARGDTLQSLARWRSQGRSLVLIDTALPRLPVWKDPAWPAHFADLKILVADSKPDDDEAAVALAAGASAYLHAYSPAEAIDRILHSVAAGDIWVGRSLVTRMLREINRRLPEHGEWAQKLTVREKEVAQRAAMGLPNQDIADALGISERTVRAHLSAVFEKLNVSDRLLLALKVHGIS